MSYALNWSQTSMHTFRFCLAVEAVSADVTVNFTPLFNPDSMWDTPWCGTLARNLVREATSNTDHPLHHILLSLIDWSHKSIRRLNEWWNSSTNIYWVPIKCQVVHQVQQWNVSAYWSPYIPWPPFRVDWCPGPHFFCLKSSFWNRLLLRNISAEHFIPARGNLAPLSLLWKKNFMNC